MMDIGVGRVFSGSLAGWMVLGGFSCNPSQDSKAIEPAMFSETSPATSVALGISSSDIAPKSTSEKPLEAPAVESSKGGSTCPEEMVRIEGGVFRMGSPWARSPESDYYAHVVALRPYCIDITEVTVEKYRSCVEEGGCAIPHKAFGCTYYLENKDDHPINCLDFQQAVQGCKAMGKRLPTEEEWEFAAKGGKEHRTYSWGEEPPSYKVSCYNHHESCPVRHHAPGAFGLYGMNGNVWEWTSSHFVHYSGPNLGDLRVYRGGSYSRFLPRWMKTWVRNRYKPDQWGAHLGIRCVSDLADTSCPEDTTPVLDDATRCLFPGEVIPRPGVPGVAAKVSIEGF